MGGAGEKGGPNPALPTKGGGWLDSEEPASPGFPRRAGRAGEEEGRGGVVAGRERKGMVRKGEYRDGGWWLGDDGFGDGGLEMMGLGWWLGGWWVVNAVLGMVDGILIIT